MKRKILSVFLCSIIMSGAICSCGHDEIVTQTGGNVITDISTEEWTTEKLCEAVLINGKNISPICTLHDFGDEFEIDTKDELGLVYREDNQSANAGILFSGKRVGGFSVMQCNGEDKVFDSPLNSIIFDLESDEEIEYPVSVNGVTIGSSSEIMLKNLYFMEKSDYSWDDEKKSYALHYKTTEIDISVFSTENKVDYISIRFEKV
ncbi:MAG: hypothetical protein IKV85_02480 [Ruminococcus sp.]|nr:hypothetical protein [Ruminococcus sp.]